MKVTHIKLASRKKNEDETFNYFFLARIKLGLLVMKHYTCQLTSPDPKLTELVLKKNLLTIDVNELLSAELKNPTQQMWLGTNFHDSELGEVFMNSFESKDFGIFGKAAQWNKIDCKYGDSDRSKYDLPKFKNFGDIEAMIEELKAMTPQDSDTHSTSHNESSSSADENPQEMDNDQDSADDERPTSADKDSNDPTNDLNAPNGRNPRRQSGGFSFLTMGDGSTAMEIDGDITWHGEKYEYANATKSEIRPKSVPSHQFDDTLSTILVVDDDVGCRESARLVLKHNHNVLTAEGGVPGLEILEEKNIDLLITGIQMPSMNGVELLTSVREKYTNLPVLILTGYGDLKTAFKCISLGAFDYLEKPFTQEGLQEAVRHALAYSEEYKWVNFKRLAQKFDNQDILELRDQDGASEIIASLLK